MLFFTKAEYRELTLPFIFYDDPEDLEFGGISVEAYGNVFGEKKFCYATYMLKNKKMYDNGEYEELRNILTHAEGRNVRIVFKLKKGKLKDFKIDLDSLAKCCNDERIKSFELLGWGLNDKSIKELNAEYIQQKRRPE